MFLSSSIQSTDKGSEIMEELGNSLSQSISKLQTLQNQLSGVNRQVINDRPGNILTLDSYRSASSGTTLTPCITPQAVPHSTSVDDFIQDILDRTSRTDEQIDVNSNISGTSSMVMQRLWEGENVVSSNVANNISRPGQTQKAKATLSSMENSYQNIKRKTPVNQVKSSATVASASPGNVTAGQSSVNFGSKIADHNEVSISSLAVQKQKSQVSAPVKKSLAQSTAEDYLRTLNSAAVTIQKWYRRHKTRRAAAEAAMRRLLSQKKMVSGHD